MDLKTLFEMQDKLDRTILMNMDDSKYGPFGVEPKDLTNERMLALIVEVGELANALKGDGFKYWSMKPAEPKERLLDEYVDVLHFFLSVGLSLGFTHEDVEAAYIKKNKVNFERQENGY